MKMKESRQNAEELFADEHEAGVAEEQMADDER